MSSDAYRVIGMAICIVVICIVSFVIPFLTKLAPITDINNNNETIRFTILDNHKKMESSSTVAEFQEYMKRYTGIYFSDYDLERANVIEVEILRKFNGNSNVEFNLLFFKGNSLHLQALNIDLNKDYNSNTTNYKEGVLAKLVSVSVYENSLSESTVKLITVGNYQNSMKEYDCVPFTSRQILDASEVETTAFGWSDTIFKLTFRDGREIRQHACHV